MSEAKAEKACNFSPVLLESSIMLWEAQATKGSHA